MPTCNVQGVPFAHGLGCVGLNFECPTECLAEAGGQDGCNILICQPKQGARANGPHCIVFCIIFCTGLLGEQSGYFLGFVNNDIKTKYAFQYTLTKSQLLF